MKQHIAADNYQADVVYLVDIPEHGGVPGAVEIYRNFDECPARMKELHEKHGVVVMFREVVVGKRYY